MHYDLRPFPYRRSRWHVVTAGLIIVLLCLPLFFWRNHVVMTIDILAALLVLVAALVGAGRTPSLSQIHDLLVHDRRALKLTPRLKDLPTDLLDFYIIPMINHRDLRTHYLPYPDCRQRFHFRHATARIASSAPFLEIGPPSDPEAATETPDGVADWLARPSAAGYQNYIGGHMFCIRRSRIVRLNPDCSVTVVAVGEFSDYAKIDNLIVLKQGQRHFTFLNPLSGATATIMGDRLADDDQQILIDHGLELRRGEEMAS